MLMFIFTTVNVDDVDSWVGTIIYIEDVLMVTIINV